MPTWINDEIIKNTTRRERGYFRVLQYGNKDYDGIWNGLLKDLSVH
jgi:hypothetical protein